MTPLLTSDWHLDDSPPNEYRWQIIESVMHASIQYDPTAIFILGDIIDRKDRHSGALVNRLVTELRKLAGRAPVVILRGNHDTPLRGPAFWEFLSAIDNIHYVTKPTSWRVFDNKPDLLLLPFTATPLETWHGIKFSDYRALFMHATVTGAVAENGTVMENHKFPILPRAVAVYSGDIHTPQTIRNITYVGAPHPVKFGDKYPCRMLLLDEAFGIKQVLPLKTPGKLIVEISDPAQLQAVTAQHGDQVKIRYQCPAGGIDQWGTVEAAINLWAKQHGAVIVGTEVMVEGIYSARAADPDQTPDHILREFAAQEGIAPSLLNVGLALLKEAQ